MGDHRASIKITARFHGKDYSTDMWINYFPYEGCGCDERVCKFFNEMYQEGMIRYEKLIWESDKENREKHEKEAELREFARLKKKYEETL